MKKKLSNEAKEILTQLRIHENSFLRKGINHNGQTIWKLIDQKLNPVTIYSDSKVQECILSGFLIRTDNGFGFNQTIIVNK